MTSKRPLSSSSLEGSSSLPTPSNELKKIKVDNAPGQDTPAMIITDPVHAELRTAVNIKNALDIVHKLSPLGYCPTKVLMFRQQFGLDRDDDDRTSPERGITSKDLTNQAILDDLETVYKDMKSLSISHVCGRFNYYSFALQIIRPGCEYDDGVGGYSPKIDGLLPDWFEHSAISGYGDMQSLETKVNSEVRNAREIPASEFKIKPELLKKIQDTWGEHFLPRNVRVEPYKIHLYGPGGHFKSHRDTPETGLVGTFLVGLGDTSSTSDGNFRIGDKTLRADRLDWVAFHPDVVHEVTKLDDGYRAVIAFKIFRADDKPDVLPSQLEGRMKKILDQIPVPFGIFTTHQYSMGTSSLSGFDALLSACAHSRNDIRAHMLPVVIDFSGEAFFDEDDGESVFSSRVYPFTRAHVDILLEKNVEQAEKEVQWLDGVSRIPFYTWDLEKSSEVWKKNQSEGANYTGNEADSTREDSVYLSYAILFLPRP